MNMLKVNIKETGNQAITDDPRGEMSRILREIADKIFAGHVDGNCRDYNGNIIGEWWFAEPETK